MQLMAAHAAASPNSFGNRGNRGCCDRNPRLRAAACVLHCCGQVAAGCGKRRSICALQCSQTHWARLCACISLGSCPLCSQQDPPSDYMQGNFNTAESGSRSVCLSSQMYHASGLACGWRIACFLRAGMQS